MSRAGGKVGILNFAWVLFEVSGDKKGSSPVFSCVHCAGEEGGQVQQIELCTEKKPFPLEIREFSSRGGRFSSLLHDQNHQEAST